MNRIDVSKINILFILFIFVFADFIQYIHEFKHATSHRHILNSPNLDKAGKFKQVNV